jgi:FAD/FMN-containing dehydrogenase
MTTTRRTFLERSGLGAALGLVGGCRALQTSGCEPVLPNRGAPLCSGSHAFSNWAHTIQFRPRRFCLPQSEQQVADLVREALAAGTGVRTQGAGHSFSQLLVTTDTLVSLDVLDRPIVVDGHRVTVPGGMRLKCLIPELRKRGLGLKNLGSVTEQSIAGAISTGTHGSGLGLGAMSTQVLGVRMVTGNGDVHTVTEGDATDLAAARVNLGALGIITEVTLDCVPDYELEYTAYLTRFDDVIGLIDALNAENERVVLWWLLLPLVPRDTMVLLTKNPPGGPRGTLAQGSVQASANVRARRLPMRERDLLEAAREAPARGFKKIHQVVSDYDEALTIPLLPVFHRECEYAVPVANAEKALRAIREVVEEGDVTLTLPIEVRFVAADDALLSPCRDRAVCYIGASTLPNSTEVFERFEPLMKSLGGKPHWGKNYTVTQREVAQDMYPDTYEAFRAVRDRFDPRRVFANTMLTELFP